MAAPSPWKNSSPMTICLGLYLNNVATFFRLIMVGPESSASERFHQRTSRFSPVCFRIRLTLLFSLPRSTNEVQKHTVNKAIR
jgi:hypothetical protein